MKDINEVIAKLRMEVEKGDEDTLFQRVIKLVEQFYTSSLYLEEHEVAIFLTNKEKTVLSFACPDYLVDSGMIPVSSTEAFTASIYRTGRGVIENNFQQQKHLSIFEIIRTPDDKVKPVWKMMGALIAAGEEKVGVVEISRRSVSPAEAGEDFTDSELRFLEATATKLAPFIRRAMPENFRGKIT